MVRKSTEKKTAHQLYCDYEVRKANANRYPIGGTKPPKSLGVKYHDYTTIELKDLLQS